MIETLQLGLSESDPWYESVLAAIEARGQAHAPYSKFKVGAAVRFSDGRIFGGANVENVSYGLTMCAERVAVYRGVFAGAGRMVELAVAVADPALPYPCGACLQVMAEFGSDFPVHLVNTDRIVHVSFSQLLPYRFTF
ncbi:cytidine deaminase [bacterium]|nr:cytidine deaminase [bacterium]